MVGAACADSRHSLNISYPVSNGQVQDWDAMERVWDHTFEHILKLDAAARARTTILLTEPPMNSRYNRQEHAFPAHGVSLLSQKQAGYRMSSAVLLG